RAACARDWSHLNGPGNHRRHRRARGRMPARHTGRGAGAAHDCRRPRRSCAHQCLRGHDRARPALCAPLHRHAGARGLTIPVITLLARMTLALLPPTGPVSSFAAEAIREAVHPPYYRRQIARQMLEIGYYSLPVVGLTAIFTGMVLALQSYTGFAR